MQELAVAADVLRPVHDGPRVVRRGSDGVNTLLESKELKLLRTGPMKEVFQ